MQRLDMFDEFCAELKETNMHIQGLLDQLPLQNLCHSFDRGNISYYQIPPGGNTANRTGIGKNPELVDLLIFKKYLESMQRMTATNLQALHDFYQTYTEPAPETVIAAMPAHDQRLPFARVLQKYGALLEPPRPVIEEYPSPPFVIGAQQRLQIASHEAWGNAPFARSRDSYGNRNKITSRGLDVSSRGELLVAEKLYDYGIPFHHEEILRIGNLTLVPDFTFEDARLEPFFLEVCGMMADAGYAMRHMQKLRMYEDMGVYPWKNLLLLYSDGDEIDMRVADSMIRYQIIPRL